MKYHPSTTQYHCGIDLHSTQMYVCIMDTSGKVLLHMNSRGNDFEFFLHRIAPWRYDMTIFCECIFNWYWMADACHAAGLQFVLAHALYLKAIHGGKKQKRPHRLRRIDPPATQQSHPPLLRVSGEQAPSFDNACATSGNEPNSSNASPPCRWAKATASSGTKTALE
ncbi:MAG: hypothetical protein ACI9R3_004919 [Verrucomicrobiales bacterium]|jgi:hypothetical protein